MDVGRLDDLGVALLLAREEAGHLVGGARRRIEAELREALAHLGLAQDAMHLAREALQHLVRRAGGRRITAPRGGVAAPGGGRLCERRDNPHPPRSPDARDAARPGAAAL